MFERVIAFTDSFLDKGIPGYDIMICKDGQCVLRHWNGFSDLENKIPMNGKEHYDIYSCSKLITCTAALQLWEQGKFQLTDRLSDYMPEFKNMTVQTEQGIVPAKNPILIQHLFEMTAGFSYDMNSTAVQACRADTEGRCPTRSFMLYLAKEPLLFEPGDQYHYSLCHDVLSALVEVLSGQKFEHYVQQHIFDPVGMRESAFLARPVAAKYLYNADTCRLKPITRNGYRIGTEYASGGAGAVSTVEDYVAFAEALRTGKLLKPETLRLMSTDRLSEHQRRTFTIPTAGYGLGVRTPREGFPFTEFGWGGAAGAYIAIDPVHNLTVFYAQHVLKSPIQALRSGIYTLIYEELTGTCAGDFQPDKAAGDLTY